MEDGDVVGQSDRAVLMTGDSAFGEAMASVCRRRGVDVAAAGTTGSDPEIVLLDLGHEGSTTIFDLAALLRDGVQRVVAIGDPTRMTGEPHIDAWVRLDAHCDELVAAINEGGSRDPAPQDASRGHRRGSSETGTGDGEATLRIIFAEPRRLLRDAFAEALHQDHCFEVTATDGDVDATILQTQRVRPSVVVVPSRHDLPHLCARLQELDGAPPTLVFDRLGSEDSLLHAIESGAAGYVTGNGGLAGLAQAVHAIANGDSVVPPAMLGPLLRRLIERQREAASAMERLVVLTPREREVLALLAEGRDAAGIASVLFISPETARTHLQRVLRKLGVHSRREAIALVATSGLAERLGRMVERSAS
jgi:DNA-binding NarL/FixJ family response regulator